jgi:hypothetical protein
MRFPNRSLVMPGEELKAHHETAQTPSLWPHNHATATAGPRRNNGPRVFRITVGVTGES